MIIGAFEPEESLLNADGLKLSAFIGYLISENLIGTSHYLTSVEPGNEIVAGEGNTDITGYKITIEEK